MLKWLKRILPKKHNNFVLDEWPKITHGSGQISNVTISDEGIGYHPEHVKRLKEGWNK